MLESQLHTHEPIIVSCAVAIASGNHFEADEIAQRARMLLMSNYERIKNEDGTIDEPLVKLYVKRASGHHIESEKRYRDNCDSFDALVAPIDDDNRMKKDARVGSTDAFFVEDSVELSLYMNQLIEALKSQCSDASLKVLNLIMFDPEQSNSDVGSVIGRGKDTVRKHKIRIAKMARSFDVEQGGYFRNRYAI